MIIWTQSFIGQVIYFRDSFITRESTTSKYPKTHSIQIARLPDTNFKIQLDFWMRSLGGDSLDPAAVLTIYKQNQEALLKLELSSNEPSISIDQNPTPIFVLHAEQDWDSWKHYSVVFDSDQTKSEVDLTMYVDGSKTIEQTIHFAHSIAQDPVILARMCSSSFLEDFCEW